MWPVTASTDDDALAFRTHQVAALRALLAQRSAELDEARAALAALRAELDALNSAREVPTAQRP